MVFEKVRKILSDQLEIDEENITMESDLIEDLKADSSRSWSSSWIWNRSLIWIFRMKNCPRWSRSKTS